MKVTLQQKRKIIREAKKDVIEWNGQFLCIVLSNEIMNVLKIECRQKPELIAKIFPRFTLKNAQRKCFADEQTMMDTPYAWWETHNVESRIQFLDYLLTGKLPAKKKVKK